MGPILGGGSSVFVENKAGGGTRVGTTDVANARPDGHSFLFYPPVAWIGYFYSQTFDRKMWQEMTPVVEFANTPYNSLISKAGSGLDTWAKVVEKGAARRAASTAAAPPRAASSNTPSTRTCGARASAAPTCPIAAGPRP
jgi:tripartite-type tricarboxylate transporter receptor subunit TctC